MIKLGSEQQPELSFPGKDTIVLGPAGSGKSILAIKLAIELAKESSVLFIVFTKALKEYANWHLKKIGNTANNIAVSSIDNGIRNKDYFTYIIIDEAQDISNEDLMEFESREKTALYLFGDDEQRLYTLRNGNETINLKSLVESGKYLLVNLNYNYRHSRQISRLIKELFPRKEFLSGSFNKDEKVVIKRFKDLESELNFLKEFIHNTKYQNIAILCERNLGFQGCYNDRLKVKAIGIDELAKYLEEQGIKLGYKSKEIVELDFDKRVNILTYHSSKGLEFDCVILPFFSGIDVYQTEEHANSLYVALCRGKHKIIITSNLLTNDRLMALNLTSGDYEYNDLIFPEELGPYLQFANFYPDLSDDALLQKLKELNRAYQKSIRYFP